MTFLIGLPFGYAGDGSGVDLWLILALLGGVPVAGLAVYVLAMWALNRKQRRRE